MSLIHEIHNQRPAVRNALFISAAVITVSVAVFIVASSVQKDVFFAMHPDAAEQQAFLARRDESRPHPLAAISRATGSLMASIGSLIGWDHKAGFDRGGEQDRLQGGVHLLPLSE
jgi:hypothetical protein